MNKRKVDYSPWLIWGGFLLLSLLALKVMYPSYQVKRHDRAVYRHLKADETEKAIVQLQELIRLNPQKPKWHKMLGQAYLDLDPMQPQKALEQFGIALDLDSSLDLDLAQAICWSELGRTDKADQILKAGLLPSDPGDLADEPAVNFLLGRKAFEAKDYQKAAHYFQAAAADPRWDARSESYRRQIEKIVSAEQVRQPS